MSAKRSKHGDEESDEDFVKLELEGFSPEGEDRDGIIQMLKQLLPKTANLRFASLADYIIGRDKIGTVVKYSDYEAEDDDDEDIVFSITSLINLFEPDITQYPIIADLCKFLESFINSSKSSNPDASTIVKVLTGASSERPALLINERYVNLPAEVAEKSVSSLLDEINVLPENEKPTHIIVLTRAIKSPDSSELIYIQPEMKSVRKFALAISETNVVTPTVDDENETITFVTMVVDVPSLPEIVDNIATSST
nr:CDK regulator involved in ribosome export [Hymenolepis microstoma]